MSDAGRVTNYDAIAGQFDRRYSLLRYDGVGDTLLNFLGDTPLAALEVGCGTGHWLSVTGRSASGRSASLSGERQLLAGVEPSAGMLARAVVAAPGARLVRARAEDLPWRDATFDRIFCINALHHFSSRQRFFAEARRLLKPGGGLLTVGKDPHAERDEWWVYDYFEETRAIDNARFAPVRTLRGELALAGFAWAESLEADRIERSVPASEAFVNGMLDASFTSQLTVLSDEEYQRGLQRVRLADAAAGGELQLVTDFRLYATVGWVG